MVNSQTFVGQGTSWMSAVSISEYGDRKSWPQLLRDRLPINNVDHVNTPLLAKHGTNDTKLPVAEAEQVVKTSKRQGVDM